MLDASGNLILQTGDMALSDGIGDACCCTPPFCGCTTLPTSIDITFHNVDVQTSCQADPHGAGNSCKISGGAMISAGKLNGTVTLTADGACTWDISTTGVIEEGFSDGVCGSGSDGGNDHLFVRAVHDTAGNWYICAVGSTHLLFSCTVNTGFDCLTAQNGVPNDFTQYNYYPSPLPGPCNDFYVLAGGVCLGKNGTIDITPTP